MPLLEPRLCYYQVQIGAHRNIRGVWSDLSFLRNVLEQFGLFVHLHAARPDLATQKPILSFGSLLPHSLFCLLLYILHRSLRAHYLSAHAANALRARLFFLHGQQR